MTSFTRIAVLLTAVLAFFLPISYTKGEDPISAKLDKIIIPKVEFIDCEIDEALDFLRKRARDLDPAGKGVNIILQVPTDFDRSCYTVTFSLKDIPLRDAIDYVARSVNLETKVERSAVVVSLPQP
jgi:hypothetical protein